MAVDAAPVGREHAGPARVVTIAEARTIAERLGLPEEAVRALQRRGFLRRLDLDDAEIRERLWRGCYETSLSAEGASDDGGRPAVLLGDEATVRP